MLLRTIALFSLFTVFSLGISIGSMAEEAPAGEAPMDLTKAQKNAMQGKVSDLIKTLEQVEAQHFLVMYTNYNLYSMVKAVREDVSEAVNACAENNKDMADELHNRFKLWDESVGGTMKEAHANIKNMSLAQTYVPQTEIKMIFGLVDEVRATNSSRFETVPVTTPEACEFMLSKMDETQESMNTILRSTLVSYPNLQLKTQK